MNNVFKNSCGQPKSNSIIIGVPLGILLAVLKQIVIIATLDAVDWLLVRNVITLTITF
jgi:hypothetical protein